MKRRPSHKKEIKDSINLEQYLMLSHALRQAGFIEPILFISSNTNDFADENDRTRIHPDLRGEFQSANLVYFNNLRAALGRLAFWGTGQVP